MKKNVWVTASHIAGVENVEADYLSRNFNPDMEWMLHPEIFEEINKITGTCDIDLFASRDDKQISTYVSFSPDKHATAVYVFKILWSELKCYIFSPFCVLSRVLQKIMTESVEAVIVAPIWPICQQKQIDIFNTNVNNVEEYLTRLYKSGLGYISLNTTRSALSSFWQLANSVNIGSHPLVCRF